MELIPYALEIWQLNTSHDLAKNLRVIKPPYEEDGFYSSEFFFDKRFWLENVLPEWSRVWKDFYDYIDCNWRRYYYYKEWEKTYIGSFNWTSFINLTPDWFVVNDKSPLRLTKGIWWYNTNSAVWTVWSTIVKTNYRWEYNKDTNYAINDIVIYWWEYYTCKLASINFVPTNTTYWNTITDWLPATFTLYTLTFTSNLDNNPCVITIDWKDILVWEWYLWNEESARDWLLDKLELIFPTYTIYREWLKYVFRNSSTPVNISINTSTNKLKQIEFWGIINEHTKVTVVVDWVTYTTEWITDYAWWLYDELNTWYKVKEVWSKVIIANNVWTYSPSNTIWDDIAITKIEYDRYTYFIRWWSTIVGPSYINLWIANNTSSDASLYKYSQDINWVTYSYTLPTWLDRDSLNFNYTYNLFWTISENNKDDLRWLFVDYLYNQIPFTKYWLSIYPTSWIDFRASQFYFHNNYAQISFTNAKTSYVDYNQVEQIFGWISFSLSETNNKTTITISNVNLNWLTDWTQEESTITSIPTYDDWYLNITYTSTVPLWSKWYIVFTSWVLKWITVRIEANLEWHLFILWTNLRSTKPKENDTFQYYQNLWDTIYVWWSTWLHQVFLNWVQYPLILEVDNLDQKEILDVTSYNWSIFALTRDQLYYSTISSYSNWDFFILNFFNIVWWYRLFNIWKAVIVFWVENKLLSTLTKNNEESFWLYDLNYNWNLYSKYSCIFVDQTIMIFQDDKQLLKADINEVAKNTFNINVEQTAINVRWIFNNITSWDVYFGSQDRYIYLINVIVDWTTISWYRTITYVYDKQYTHWTINEYEFKIINFWNKLIDMTWYTRYWILWIDHVSYEWEWFLDFWTLTYSQELNFRLWDWERLMMPYIVRTLFWMPDVELNVNLDIAFEIWGKREVMYKLLNWYEYDLRLTEESEIVWDLIWYEDLWLDNWAVYDWSVVWIQDWIYKTWRFVFFKYHWYNRFIIWKSFVLTEKTKVFINELTLVN